MALAIYLAQYATPLEGIDDAPFIVRMQSYTSLPSNAYPFHSSIVNGIVYQLYITPNVSTAAVLPAWQKILTLAEGTGQD